MTVAVQLPTPLSPHIGANNDALVEKRRASLSRFSSATPFKACVNEEDDVDCASILSSEKVCQPCGAENMFLDVPQQPTSIKVRRRKDRRTVSFSISSNQEFPSLHKDDYTAEEFRAAWYMNSELNEMKKARQSLIQRMEEASNWGHLEGSSDVCVRGLEGRTKSSRRKRYAEFLAVTAAVLGEQDVQYARGILDATVIAEICEMHTRQSMVQARCQGLKDERTVKMLYPRAPISHYI